MTKILLIGLLSILVSSCQKQDSIDNGTNPTNKELPRLTTTSVVNIGSTSATSGGTIISTGNDSISAKGLCWATTPYPTLANFSKLHTGSNGTFSMSIQGLTKNQTYYVRVFATNSVGTAYGNQISFTTDSIAHVYISGESDGRSVYWKDGNLVPLTNSGTSVSAWGNSIFVDNDDIYVAGNELNFSTGIREGKIWKNGIARVITNGNFNSNAIDVAIVNNDTFVLGTEVNLVSYKSEGKIWRNGISTTLQTFTNPADGSFRYAYPQSLFIYNNDVYVGGYEVYGVNSDLRGIVWKNGIPTRLFGFCYGVGGVCTFDYTQVNDIFVVDNDVYAIGTSPNASTGMLDNIMWKNGVPSLINISPSSIFVYNNDIYIAGRVGNFACIWKNGTTTQLTNGVKQGFATSVYVKENDVYVTGFDRDPVTAFSVAKVWKNGIVTNLTNGSGTAGVYNIFVK